jgi:hypothetical protein
MVPEVVAWAIGAASPAAIEVAKLSCTPNDLVALSRLLCGAQIVDHVARSDNRERADYWRAFASGTPGEVANAPAKVFGRAPRWRLTDPDFISRGRLTDKRSVSYGRSKMNNES